MPMSHDADAIYAAWQSLSNRSNVTYIEFIEFAKSCDVYSVLCNNVIAGAVLVIGPDIHACILPFAKGKWMNRKHLRIINAIIDKHGYAQTSATTDDGKDFVTRLGFVQDGSNFIRTKKWALNH
jgi:hypothetical protein